MASERLACHDEGDSGAVCPLDDGSQSVIESWGHDFTIGTHLNLPFTKPDIIVQQRKKEDAASAESYSAYHRLARISYSIGGGCEAFVPGLACISYCNTAD